MENPNAVAVVETEAFETDIDNLNETEMAEWQKTGKFPPKKAAVAEVTPKPKEAETGAEGSDSQADTHRQERKPTEAEKRIKELLGEVKSLQDENSKLKAPKAEAQPKADRTKPTMQDKAADGSLKYPATDEGFEKYTDDMLDWKQEQRDAKDVAEKAEAEKKTRESKIAEQRAKQEESWKAQAEESKKAHEDFEEIAYAKDIPLIENSLPDQWLLRSPKGAEMLYFFGQNKAELKRINALHPDDQLRELVKLEDKLSEPAANRVTRASKPPSEVGARQAASADAVKSAVESEDYEAYASEVNAREIALKGGKKR